MPPVDLPLPGVGCAPALAESAGDVELAAAMSLGQDVCRSWAAAGTWAGSIAGRRVMRSGYVELRNRVEGKSSPAQVSPSVWDSPARVSP